MARWRALSSESDVVVSIGLPFLGREPTVRRGDLTRNNGNRQSLRSGGPPLALEQGVDELALPLALDPLVLAQVRLAPHPEPLQHARRRAVARFQGPADAVQPVCLEADLQHGRGGLRRIAAALVVRVDDEADLALAVRPDRQRDVA